MDAPSGGAPEQAPRWDLVDTESYGGGNRVLAPFLIVWGYVDIYRRKEYVGGATGGPQGWMARLVGVGAPSILVAPLTDFLRLYILMYLKNIHEHHETLFPPPQPYVPVGSHLGAFSGARRRGNRS